MILGAHERVTGGVSTAFVRAEEDGADCLQIFTRNVRGWAARPFDADEVERFRAEARRTRKPVAAHSTYLVNLCCQERAIRDRSWDALADELARCERLGIRWLVFHPGSHQDEREGIRMIGEGMAHALERSPGKTRLLVETTAGQGTSIGWRFEQLAAIRQAVPSPYRRRVGICVDTCHVHAAGYDIISPEGYQATFDELDRCVGLSRVEAFHLNDSKRPRGSRVDRHEHIGAGHLGLAPFRRLVNDRRFDGVPGFLETELRFKENLAVLRSLIR
jgi:deoxyribonuclease-4